MRIPGVCTECNRVKQVQVSGNQLVMAQARHTVPRGICVDCDRKMNCKHLRHTDGPRQVRCLYCSTWGRRDPRNPERIVWSP